MKKLLTKFLAIGIVTIVFSWNTTAQIVGSNAFMQGTYVEAGINGCGAYASNGAPPAGYVVTGLSGLNFIADSDGDGWGVGTPGYCGDYAVPGSPVEGWGVEINGVSYHNTDLSCFTSDIDGEITSYTAEGDSIVVIWEGSVAGVDITQRSVLYTSNFYVLTVVTFTNSSGSDIIDMYYKRNIDPDNEQLATGSFVTTNTVESSPYLGDLDAIVTAVGGTYFCYLAIVARNPNARVSIGGFSTVGGAASNSYNGISPYSLSGSAVADAAIQMNFIIPFLANGESSTIAFAHVFSDESLEAALEDTYVGGYDDCAGVPEVTPASASVSTTCASTVFSVATSVPTAAGYTYQWQISSDGVTFSDIPGANSVSYSTSQTEAHWYQCIVTCTASGESATAAPVFVDNLCPGCMDPEALNYNAEANEDDGSCFYGYTISDCDYEGSLITTPGGLTELCLSDDAMSGAIAIGFSFPFYGVDFTNVYVSSNGWMTFTSGLGSGCCSGAFLPTAAYPNSIFFAHEDLDPNSCIDGNIYTWTQGDPGSQIFVLSFEGVPHYPGPAGVDNVTAQVQLFEATGEIKIVTTEMNAASGNHTMGLNKDATLAQPVDGRNSAYWTAFDECISFMPYGSEEETCNLVPPTSIYVDGISATGATVNYTPATLSDGTRGVLYNLSTGSLRKFTASAESSAYTFPSILTPSTTYGVRLKTICLESGEISDYSPWYYFTTSPLREGEFAKEFTVYPNPNNGTFRVQLSGYDAGKAQLTISNTVGQIVYDANMSIDSNVSAQDVSLQLAAGTYFVKVISGSEVFTQSIVIE